VLATRGLVGRCSGLWHILPSLGLATDNEAIGPAARSARAGRRRCSRVAGTVLFTAASGVVFCELRRRSGSLLAPAGLHWAVKRAERAGLGRRVGRGPPGDGGRRGYGFAGRSRAHGSPAADDARPGVAGPTLLPSTHTREGAQNLNQERSAGDAAGLGGAKWTLK